MNKFIMENGIYMGFASLSEKLSLWWQYCYEFWWKQNHAENLNPEVFFFGPILADLYMLGVTVHTKA